MCYVIQHVRQQFVKERICYRLPGRCCFIVLKASIRRDTPHQQSMLKSQTEHNAQYSACWHNGTETYRVFKLNVYHPEVFDV